MTEVLLAEIDILKKKCEKYEQAIEDIKAEIAELIEWHDCPIEYDNGNDAWYREACNRALEIIDKHTSGKEQNANKED